MSARRTETLSMFAVPAPAPAKPVYVAPVVPAGPKRPGEFRVGPAALADADAEVTIEPTGDGCYWVQLVRGDAARFAVRYSRRQLEALLRRIPAALEVG